MLKRKEYLGDRFGREYEISLDDERIVEKNHEFIDKWEEERAVERALGSFEDGYNVLELIDGEWYEVQRDYMLTIKRKAYNVQ